jgi:dipeptidyl aminopeptidase/acylaminoacyl peptidase
MHRLRPCLVVLALLIPLASAGAQETARTHNILVDDYFTLARVSGLALSPDAKYVAYSEDRWQESTGDRKSDLWLIDTKTAKAKKITFDRCNARNIAWSGDSQAVYFLANRKSEGGKVTPTDGKTQVWRANSSGNDLKALTQAETDVETFAATANGRNVYYVTHADRIADEWKALREKFKNIDYGHGVNKVSTVWKLDTETWRTEKLLDANRYIYEIALTPDGKKLAAIIAPDETVVHFEGRSSVTVWDTATKAETPIPDKCYRKDAASPYAWLKNLAIAPDGKTLAFNAIWDGHPCEIVLGSWKDKGWTSRLMGRAKTKSIRGYGSPLAFTKNRELAFLSEAKARVLLARSLDVDSEAGDMGWGPVGDHVVSLFSHDSTGLTKAVLMTSPTELADIYLWEEGKRPRRLTNTNPQTASWKLPKISVVSWPGANGDHVEGILELPPDHQPGQKVPLIVDIHGGPTTAYHFEQTFEWYSARSIMPAKGYAVLCPNYRGSTGYGDKFLTDLLGKENDWDVQDILKGVDHLVTKGIADSQRLAIMGWSNGGYLTNCCLTHTDRFKAAISGAGIVDAIMEFGSNDEPAYSIVFKRGFPWTVDNTYVKSSPSWRLFKVRTPTLIHVGGGDERCPPGHSRTLYRVLKEYNEVPTELLVYPGEPHGLRKYANIRGKMDWDQAWLKRYVMEGAIK